jgi:D-apiose dehydrogenase
MMPASNALRRLPLRGALLGTSSIAIFQMLAWKAIPDVQIVAIANRTRSRAEAMGRDFGIDDSHIYADHNDLLDAEDLDFVDIATAPFIHHQQVLAAAAHGVHSFCQKPLAMSLDEGREMEAACRTAGVRCIVNENWRWRPWYQEVKQMIAAGVVGAPRYARVQVHEDSVLPRLGGSAPPRLAREPTVGQMPHMLLFDWGTHMIDTMRFLFGKIDAVYARTSRASPVVTGEDMALVVLEFHNGVTGLLDCSWGTYIPDDTKPIVRGNVDEFVVEGNGGTILLEPYPDDTVVVVTPGGTERHPARPLQTRAEAYQQSYYNTQHHFVECLKTGSIAQNEIGDNMETMAALFAAYESAATGRVVPLASGR